MNDASFPPNTAPFHLPEIWQLPPPPLADSEEEESAKAVSTSNNDGGANANDNGVSDGGDGKRMKGSVNRNESGKGETEASSGKPAEQQTSQPPLEPPKKDYIHVRARRGQATDSHSLAERARRENISQRMKFLQDLVPGCNTITGKAVMLDEIINYIQSLQRQVECLQMKLEAVNSRLTPGIEVFPPKDKKKRYCRFLKWLDVADANYDLSAEMEQGKLSELKIKVDKDFAGVDKDFPGVNKEIRCLKLGVGLIGVVMLFVFFLVCVLK